LLVNKKGIVDNMVSSRKKKSLPSNLQVSNPYWQHKKKFLHLSLKLSILKALPCSINWSRRIKTKFSNSKSKARSTEGYGLWLAYSIFLCSSRILPDRRIKHYNPATFEGKGIIIAVFEANVTGTLAPFNGMFTTGTHEEDQSINGSTITLWEWQNGIPLSSTDASAEGLLLMNTTNTGDISLLLYNYTNGTVQAIMDFDCLAPLSFFIM
jgi:hypothetical protein